MVEVKPDPYLSMSTKGVSLLGGGISGATVTIGGAKAAEAQTRNKVEAIIRIQQAANGRLVQVATAEGATYTTWLCKDNDDLFDTIKQALADMKV